MINQKNETMVNIKDLALNFGLFLFAILAAISTLTGSVMKLASSPVAEGSSSLITLPDVLLVVSLIPSILLWKVGVAIAKRSVEHGSYGIAFFMSITCICTSLAVLFGLGSGTFGLGGIIGVGFMVVFFALVFMSKKSCAALGHRIGRRLHCEA